MSVIDRKSLERLLVLTMTNILSSVAHIGKINPTERFPDDDEEDALLFATADPVMGDKRLITNTCEIGLPEVHEAPYTSEEDTQLIFTYPITYSLGVVDKWDSTTFPYASSSLMLIGVFLDAQVAFKNAGLDMGLGQAVRHYYLQGGLPGLRRNTKGEADEHRHEWSIQIRVTGIKV
jgi:hypothetical protein